MTIHRWHALTTSEFSALDRESMLVLLPLGATEQHGPHLPVGTDTLIVETVLAQVLPLVPDLDLLWLPPLWCTKSDEHQAFAGSLYLHAETMMAVLHDMAEGLARAGFQRLVVMNWHGGNTDLVSVLARDLRLRHGIWVFVIDIIRSFPPAQPAVPASPPAFDIHGGRFETSVMLAAAPELVRPGPFTGIGSDLQRGRMAQSFGDHVHLSPEGGLVQVGWATTDLTSDGVIGNPEGANADEGSRSLAHMAGQVAAMLREVARFNPAATGPENAPIGQG